MLSPRFMILMASMIVVTPAIGQSVPSTVAMLAAPAKTATLLAHEQLWRCDGAECRTGTNNSRPIIQCMALARKAGPIVSFTSANRALDEAALARCNAVVAPVASKSQ